MGLVYFNDFLWMLAPCGKNSMYQGQISWCSCIVSHYCSQCARQVFDKMPLRHFLTCLNSNEYQTLGFPMFPHQEHVWIIGCVFNTPCPTCAFSILWSCIAHSHLLHTPLLLLSCIGLYLVSSSQHVTFTLCFISFCFVFCLSFIFSFIMHPLCIITIVRTFISCLHFSLTLCLFMTKRGVVFSREYTGEFLSFLHSFCAYPQGEKFYFSCTFVGGEIFHRGDTYTKGEQTLC